MFEPFPTIAIKESTISRNIRPTIKTGLTVQDKELTFLSFFGYSDDELMLKWLVL
jgi:hypothetical protein